jgi:hypothetical protein
MFLGLHVQSGRERESDPHQCCRVKMDGNGSPGFTFTFFKLDGNENENVRNKQMIHNYLVKNELI